MSSEINYILQVVFGNWLGLSWRAVVSERDDFSVRVSGCAGELRMPDAFFKGADTFWLKEGSLPTLGLSEWHAYEHIQTVPLYNPSVPVIFGDSEPKLTIRKSEIRLPLDIFGSAFFMLSRYEEAVKTDLDEFDRFPDAASLAVQAGFIERPIINEYVEILWGWMKYMWPGLIRKKRNFRTLISADVDTPYSFGTKSIIHQTKQIGADIVRRHSPSEAMRSIFNYIRAKQGDYQFDPYFPKINWMMDVNEKANNRMAFYFIAGHSDKERDGCYDLEEPIIKTLLHQINERGHEIGLHPSFNTFLDSNRMCREADKLRQILKEEGIEQKIAGGRQHYLRWRTPETARHWQDANLAYDSTLGFAKRAGFRCGTCYEYRLYDLENRCSLETIERPLVIMEAAILAHPETRDILHAHSQMSSLKQICKHYGGDFTLLWHNSYLRKPEWQELYKEIISE